MAPCCNGSRGGPGRQACAEGGPGGRVPSLAISLTPWKGVKLSRRVVASPQCRIGVHVHD